MSVTNSEVQPQNNNNNQHKEDISLCKLIEIHLNENTQEKNHNIEQQDSNYYKNNIISPKNKLLHISEGHSQDLSKGHSENQTLGNYQGQNENYYQQNSEEQSSQIQKNNFEEDNDNQQLFVQDQINNSSQMSEKAKSVNRKRLIRFNYGQFWLFLTYHFLYYLLLGPFLIVILYFQGKMPLVHNLLFIGDRFYSIMQFLIYYSWITTQAAYFLNNNSQIQFYGEIGMLSMIIMQYSVHISIKYAIFDPQYIKQLFTIKQENKSIKQKFFLGDWKLQKPNFVIEQFDFIVWKYDFEEKFIQFQFIVPPINFTWQRITQFNKLYQDYIFQKKLHLSTKTLFGFSQYKEGEYQEKQKLSAFGFGIFCNMIEQYQLLIKPLVGYLQIYFIIFCIAVFFLPFILKYFENNPLLSEIWYEKIIIVQNQILYSYITQKMGISVYYGLLDIGRLRFFLIQLAYMMSPRKMDNFKETKLFPTIDIFSIEILQGWMNLRKICIEYGKEYFIRIEAIFFIFILYSINGFFTIFLDFVKIIDIGLIPLGYLILYSLSMMFIITWIFYSGIQINQMYQLQIRLIKDNRKLVLHLYTHSSYFFTQDYHSNKLLISKAIETIKKKASHLLDQQQPEKYLKKLSQYYDYMITELNDEEYNHPFKLFGIKITMTLLMSGIIGFLSLTVTILAKFYIKNF